MWTMNRLDKSQPLTIGSHHWNYQAYKMPDAPEPVGPNSTATEDTTLAEFLESTPPNVLKPISDLAVLRHGHNNAWMEIQKPDIQLHCSSDTCDGIRIFNCIFGGQILNTDRKFIFIHYRCRNCESKRKVYAVIVWLKAAQFRAGFALKLGEVPAFGPHTPSRVITLIGPDQETFVQGRRAENLGLGMGAFVYYRRVVENQKGRIIHELGKAAKRLGASEEAVKRFAKAEIETQFTNAIEEVNDAIPQSLRIRGHNPLTLLHTALSEGLHAKTDAECLELATSIRIVLTELADRISQAVKDDAELTLAVTRLLEKEAKEAVGYASQKS